MVTVNIDKNVKDLSKMQVNLKDGSLIFDVTKLIESQDPKFVMYQLATLHSIRLNLQKISSDLISDTLKYVDGLIFLLEYKLK